VVATNYDVVVAAEASHEARRMLQQLPMTPSDASAGAAPYGQGGYQNQPFQQPGHQQGPQQGTGPQRPAGWNDPYGQRTPEAGNQPSAGAHVAGAPGHGTPAAGEEHPQHRAAPTPAVRYPDLPDGRPQYGVRVSDAPKQEEGPKQEPAEGNTQQ
jgi:hypothetical protein